MLDNYKYLSSVFVAQTLTYPIDTAKVRIQNKIPILNRGSLFFGLYQGYALQSLINVPYITGKLTIYKFASYNNIPTFYKCILTSTCETMVGLPINNVIIQMQVYKKKLSYNLIKSHIGYRGFLFQFGRDSIFNLIFFNTYEHLKNNEKYKIVNGLISGSVAAVIVTPLDYLKTNYQLGNFKLKDTFNFLNKNMASSWNSAIYRFLIKGIFYSITMYLSEY